MANLARLRHQMDVEGVGALLVSDIDNVQWLTGFTGSSGYVIVTPGDALFITDSRYTIQAGQEVSGMPVSTFASPVKASQFIASKAQDFGLPKLGFESGSVTYGTFEDWRKEFGEIELFGVRKVLEPLRMVKTETEVAAVRRACALADACFDHMVRLIQPGVCEYDIALDLEFFIRRQGAELAFEPIVVSGPNSARPHGRPGERKLQRGDFVTMDFGAKVDGYCSDITRTVVVEEATDRHREIYNQVLKAEEAAIGAMKPGVPAKQIDALARMILDEKGLAQYFGHGLGHGLGKAVHDMGRMAATSEDVFEAGQIWTVEPGVYIPDFGGVRIEDDVLVTDTGVEILTHSPKNLMILPNRA